MRLKGSNDEEYKGEVKGGLFAIYNEKGENVGNFKDVDEAVKLGGYSVIAEDAASSEKTDTPTAQPQAGQGGEITQDPKTDNKKDTPQTEKTPV